MQMQKKIVDGVQVLIGTDNVYADLGFPDAEEMLVKARLAYKITEIIQAKGWTQQQALVQHVLPLLAPMKSADPLLIPTTNSKSGLGFRCRIPDD